MRGSRVNNKVVDNKVANTAAVADENEESLNEFERLAPGVVFLDSRYYFKVGDRQYTFGRRTRIKDETSSRCGQDQYTDLLYPTSFESLLRIYYRYVTADKCNGKNMHMREFVKIVKETQELISAIAEKIESVK